MKANKSWFKLKRYPHIGLPISPNQRNDIEKFIHNKIKISHYAFLPLIRREHRTFKYKKFYADSRAEGVEFQPLVSASRISDIFFMRLSFTSVVSVSGAIKGRY